MIVPDMPTIEPIKRNILIIPERLIQIVLIIAISLVLFFKSMNKLVTTLKAAIRIINESIINITVLSTFNASK